MEIKQEIKIRFGSVSHFIRLLCAPANTVYSWTRKNDPRKPSPWQLDAYMDAATYRERKVRGWECRNCQVVTASSPAGIRPKICSHCGASEFVPVSVVREPKVEV